MAGENKKLLHGELTRLIIGAGMDVHNALGPGWDEMDYHLAMLKALAERGVKAESHLRGSLILRGECIDRFELDIMVENKVILELKHIQTNFAHGHYAQLINYLKFWKKDLGMLMNFGLEQLRFKRVPYTPNSGALATTGAWDGFPEAECVATGFDVQVPAVGLTYKSASLGRRTIDGFLIDGDLVVKVGALQDRTTASDMARLMSYMRQLNIAHGALVNFGRSELCIRGVINQSKSNLH